VNTPLPAVAITLGEPAGIGPELCAMIADRHGRTPFPARLVFVGDGDLLLQRGRRIGLALRLADYDPASFAPAGGACEVWRHPLAAPAVPGRPDTTNAYSTIAMLGAAADACAAGRFDALVTAPVQKSALAGAGIPFSGHTEFFARRAGVARVVMMLVGGAGPHPLRVALVTTHLPLSAVPAAITRDAVAETLDIVAAGLESRFGIDAPRIAVCGLNPHAGEDGHLGREEIDVIAPAIADARERGLRVVGPLPADTAFLPDRIAASDAIVAMYHDQGLPVLKALSFGGGVNVTLGLPYVRTSVDHGTALDLAADARRAKTADPGSFVAALLLALRLASAR
jgi:4-hydroxythreonine-4-phosphate dehydrogenase